MPKNRINNFHWWALLLLAIIVDFLQFFFVLVPFVGFVLASIFGILARIVFWIWFKVLRVGFADKMSRFAVNAAVTVAEVLPFIAALPAWTLGTLAIMSSVRKEDREAQQQT